MCDVMYSEKSEYNINFFHSCYMIKTKLIVLTTRRHLSYTISTLIPVFEVNITCDTFIKLIYKYNT